MKLSEKDWFIPLIYLVLGFFWIALSDKLLFYLERVAVVPATLIYLIGSLKGVIYVAITAVLLYYLIRRRTKSLLLIKNDFERLFENNPNPMWIYELSTYKILLANRAASYQYGHSPSEFKNLTLYDLRPSSEHAKLDHSLRTEYSKFGDSGEWMHLNRSGELFYVNVFSHQTEYEGMKCRLVTAINVNKKVMAEVERENIQKSLDKAALVSITGTDGRIQEVNDLFCEVSGFSKAELVGQPVKMLETDYHDEAFWEGVNEQISKGELWRGDVQYKTKAGDLFWVDMIISPIKNHSGEVYKYMSVNYDITERKALEINQQALLDDFADYAFQTSHKLRGPLSSMLGLISIFKKYEDPGYLIDKMKETSERMDLVIREMNDSLSRNAFTLITTKRNKDKNRI
ncbi:PAS domain S-box protein [Marivirga sp. S37H4]|uniref:histidine kinase n=1 Tax=Marivirga aurantiaca TaxID=2802615 RepID=A0A934WV38_9BACT|nr:PAS domain S-box protein [Marivirga aurantiaca]MBK6263583.1 PAS domain S-box protein [Marivirga aurantiaca]